MTEKNEEEIKVYEDKRGRKLYVNPDDSKSADKLFGRRGNTPPTQILDKKGKIHPKKK